MERIRTAQRRGRQRAPVTSAEWAALAGNVNSCFLWVRRFQAGVSLSKSPLTPADVLITHSCCVPPLHLSPIQSHTTLTANTTHLSIIVCSPRRRTCACLCCLNVCWLACFPPNWRVGGIFKDPNVCFHSHLWLFTRLCRRPRQGTLQVSPTLPS